MALPATFPELLTQRLLAAPAQPLVTAYDDATGERTELSVVTYANWVAKTANLLTDELMLDQGDVVLVDLPTHWLGPVFLGAAWTAGLVVTTDPAETAEVVVCGPDHERHRDRGVPVLASALLPFGVRFTEAPPEGVLDYGVLWPGQSDVFAPIVSVTPEEMAWRGTEGELSQAELISRAAGLDAGVRLLTDRDPLLDAGVPGFLAPLLAGGSVVLVRNADEARWPAHHEGERATGVLRAQVVS